MIWLRPTAICVRNRRSRGWKICPTRAPCCAWDSIAAGEAVLLAEALENPLGRVPLLGRRRPVGLQDRVDHRDQRSELRPPRLLGAHIARRRRKPAHLGDRVPAQTKCPRRFPSAFSFNENKLPNRCVNLHGEHPRPPSTKLPIGVDLESGRFLNRHAPAPRRRSVADYCAAAYILDPPERACVVRALLEVIGDNHGAGKRTRL